MTNSCEQIKTEYENLKTLKEEFDLEYQKAIETGNLEKVREMKAELEEKRDALQEKLFVSPEKAKEIMGNEDFLGQEAVEIAFGIKLNKQEIPRIPFKKEELERAKELGQFLVLRTDKASDGQSLTMEKMNEFLQTEFQQRNKGKILYDIDWHKDEDFFKKDTPKLEWALTSKEVIPNSTSKNHLEQTGIIADYLKNQVFKDKQLPKQYEEAIQEFNQYHQDNFQNKTKGEIKTIIKSNRKEYAQQLSELKINRLTRQSVSEALYDILIYFQNNNQRLLENKFTWTKRSSSDGALVHIGYFNSEGADVNRWHLETADGRLGVSFSRGL
ncbi:hypothetical protein KKC49_00675 [Patescibacteria group bacterium]|nr:hypothetical protein [Patescibacteria group bacterium]MCG2809106.1 hypothetical protein [Candidatus Portnoybacteria bacterium]